VSSGASSDDDAPLKERVKAPTNKKAKVEKHSDDSDDDAPLAVKSKAKVTKKTTSSVVKKKPVKKEESDDDVPLARTKASKSAKPAKRVNPESDSDDAPIKPKKKVKTESKSATNGGKKDKSSVTPSPKKPAGKKRVMDEDVKDEEDEEEYRWWEDQQGDGTKKWTTLEHNGVLFPPPYEPLPKHVKMKYAGKEVTLPPEAEEVAGFFGALIESDHGKNPTFQQNFFNDWLAILKDLKVVRTYNSVQGMLMCDRHPRSRRLRNAILRPCGNTLKPKRKRKRNLPRKKRPQ
jgi:DNA topoisomerase-1